MKKAAALQSFFESFGIPAYPNTSVEKEEEMPYLTYTPVFDTFGYPTSITVNLWYRTTSEAIPNAKAQEISDYIGGGKYVPFDSGAILITRGSPWCQSLIDADDNTVKRRYININAEYLTEN